MVLFRFNVPQPTQAQLMRGELPETLCIEQGVVLSFRFAESKAQWTSRVLWTAVVSQSSKPFLTNHRRSRNHYFVLLSSSLLLFHDGMPPGSKVQQSMMVHQYMCVSSEV